MTTIEEWMDQLACFPEAAPELTLRRELRRRTVSKFIMSPSSVTEFLLGLTGDYAVQVAGPGPVAFYRTLYFDTEGLDFFHAHRCGYRVRHKVRIRHYPDRQMSSLEVKTRRSELETVTNWRERDYGDDELSAEDRAFVVAHTGLREIALPQVWTLFRRVTLLGIHQNERMTLDFDLGVTMGQSGRSFGNVAVVEVKQWPFCRNTPVMAALRSLGRRPVWMSKYCVAIAFTHPDLRRNALLPGLRGLEREAA